MDRRNAPWWLKLLLFLHVVAITSWALPKASPATLNGSVQPRGTEWILYLNDQYLKPSPLQLYVMSSGVWQSWDMFSPNPSSEDLWADAEVQYKDGSVKRYSYPRMYDLPILEKYVKERYRKFFEHANTDPALWDPFAQRFAYLHPGTASNPAIKVTLHRHWNDVPKAMPFDDYCYGVWSALRSGKLSANVLLPPEPTMPSGYNDYAYYEFNILDKQGNVQTPTTASSLNESDR